MAKAPSTIDTASPFSSSPIQAPNDRFDRPYECSRMKSPYNESGKERTATAITNCVQ